MIQLSSWRLLKGILINQTKVLRLTNRGGRQWKGMTVKDNVDHIMGVYDLFRDRVGDVSGRVGLEIGPGDNIGVAYCFLKSGAKKIYAVEKYSTLAFDEKALTVLREIDKIIPAHFTIDNLVKPSLNGYMLDTGKLIVVEKQFEEFLPGEAIDFVYSNDVLEHVACIHRIFEAGYPILSPGGYFVHNVDLKGHNVFRNASRPLDCLTCPDWLWTLLFSNLETTNRVRQFEIVCSLEDAGFTIKDVVPLEHISPDYIEALRPHLLPRYRKLSSEELAVTQCLVVARKETASW